MYQNEVPKSVYSDDNFKGVEITRPVFVDVLEQLRKEVQGTMEFSKETSLFCNAIQLMGNPNKMERVPEKEIEPGIIGSLMTEVRKLREANFVLNHCVNHLRKVVGN